MDIFGLNKIDVNVQVSVVSVYKTYIDKCFKNNFKIMKNNLLTNQNKSSSEFSGLAHVIDGEFTVKTVNDTFRLKKNNFIFLKEKEVVMFDFDKLETTIYFLWFNFTNLQLPYSSVFYVTPFEHEADSMTKIINNINYNNYYSVGIANALCAELIFNFLFETNEHPYYLHSDLMTEIFDYIHTNLRLANFKTKDISEKFGISTSYLNILFKKYTGLSPLRYMNRIKLEQALFLLTNTNHRIKDISEELNFSSVYYFISFFKKAYGISPLQYRIKNQY